MIADPMMRKSPLVKYHLCVFALLLCSLLASLQQQAMAGSLDIGVGLGFADSPASGSLEGGWDVIAGYENIVIDGWNVGAQLHFIKGWTEKNADFIDTRMYFQSTALYATARPEKGWLQFSGGVVNADFKSLTLSGNGTGLALGAGLVIGGDNLRLHLLDIHRYMVGGQVFNVYSISLGVLY